MPSCKDFLVFQLYGNLASWGDIAVGEHRPAQSWPSKSAISGLLAAALGIRRDVDEQHQNLSEYYGVAVCVQAQGEMLRDYHTTQIPAGNKNWYTRKDELTFAPLDLKTILSQPDYQMDAYYLVAIWQKDTEAAKHTLEELANALKQPVFTTSLGRKSCPPCLPYNPVITEQKTLKDALDSYGLSAELDHRYFVYDPLVAWHWEDGLKLEQLGIKPTMRYPRRDKIRSRQRWQFSRRNENYAAEPGQGER